MASAVETMRAIPAGSVKSFVGPNVPVDKPGNDSAAMVDVREKALQREDKKKRQREKEFESPGGAQASSSKRPRWAGETPEGCGQTQPPRSSIARSPRVYMAVKDGRAPCKG